METGKYRWKGGKDGKYKRKKVNQGEKSEHHEET